MDYCGQCEASMDTARLSSHHREVSLYWFSQEPAVRFSVYILLELGTGLQCLGKC